MNYTREQKIWTTLRLLIGFIFLWAFIDKLWGLGFGTPADKAWTLGVSPTAGFLRGNYGPFSDLYNTMIGSPIVDWMFMMGLLLVGLGLVSGVMIKLARWGGAVMMLMIYLSGWPPKQNPLIDQHIIYMIILLGLPTFQAGEQWFLGRWWSNVNFVKKYKWLS